jgi:polysaccharide export outer membrane protein
MGLYHVVKFRIPCVLIVLAGPALLGGCAWLPAAGPLARDVESQESAEGTLGGYVLLDVDERIASVCAAQPRESFKRAFPNAPPAPDLRIGVSDSVIVTIWEAAAGGLFSASANEKGISAGSRTATLPEQVVARDGTIEVPYAGRLKVAGLRPAQVEEEIVHALAHKASRSPRTSATRFRSAGRSRVVRGCR